MVPGGGGKEDGSSSRSWLHEREEGEVGKSQNFELQTGGICPWQTWGVGQEREDVSGRDRIGLGVVVSHPHGGDA